MKINILFPVLNEHLRLERGIRRTMEYLRSGAENLQTVTGISGQPEPVSWQLSIIDNGSDDDTPQIGKRLAAEFPEVEYVRVEQRGVGIAFRTGVERSDADIVGYMDIDLSTDISNLGRTVGIFAGQPEIVYVNASRFSRESDTKGRKWYRKITSRGLLILLKLCFHMQSTDAICGFTFVRRDAARRLVSECSDDNGWFYMIEFLLRAERDGMRILDMPVEWTEDYDTTVHVWKTIKNYLKNIVRLKKAFLQEDKRGK